MPPSISDNKEIVTTITDNRSNGQTVESERKRLATILDSMGDGVFVTNREGNLVFMNQACEKLTDHPIQASLGRHYSEVFEFLLGENVPFPSLVEDVLKTGQTQELAKDALIVQKGGVKIPVSNNISILKNDGDDISGCVVVLRDITREKEIDREKTEFISLASHQLRTPLSSINWYLELMRTGEAGVLTEEQKSYVEEAYSGAQKMARMVNALLNVSRVEAGTYMIDPKPVDVVQILNSVIEELKPLIERKKIRVVVEKQDIPTISLDPNLTTIILQNLVTNAIKYTNEGGTISVLIMVLPQHRKSLLIQVGDTGMGIPKGQQSRIFSKLFRADNAIKSDPDGTGLGLYLIKGLIEKSDGRIWFESEEGKGTIFSVTLPLSGMVKKEGTRRLT